MNVKVVKECWQGGEHASEIKVFVVFVSWSIVKSDGKLLSTTLHFLQFKQELEILKCEAFLQ